MFESRDHISELLFVAGPGQQCSSVPLTPSWKVALWMIMIRKFFYQPLYSDIVYPVVGKSELDPSHNELSSGKFEPLAHMNGLLRQEIERVINDGRDMMTKWTATFFQFLQLAAKLLWPVQRCSQEHWVKHCAVSLTLPLTSSQPCTHLLNHSQSLAHLFHTLTHTEDSLTSY